VFRQVKFQGEGVVDNGGPYRDSFNEWVHELQSDRLPLFALNPNGRNDVGMNRDHYICNPGVDLQVLLSSLLLCSPLLSSALVYHEQMSLPSSVSLCTCLFPFYLGTEWSVYVPSPLLSSPLLSSPLLSSPAFLLSRSPALLLSCSPALLLSCSPALLLSCRLT